MRIDDISVFPLRARLSVPFRWATGSAAERSAALVKITTNEGLVGWGESLDINAARALPELLPMLVHQDPLEIGAQLRAICRRLPRFGKHRRVTACAIGALEMALWDIRGKAAGLPVMELLGRSQVRTVRCYASGIYYWESNGGLDAATEAMAYVARGFTRIKMKIGGVALNAENERIASVRNAVGPKITLMADANGAYTLEDAAAIGRVLAAHDFFWLEEPLNSMDVLEHLALKERCPVLLAAGERWQYADFETFLQAGAISVAQPNVGNIGGFQEASRVMDLAAAAEIRIALHSWGTPVALAAAIHLACGAGGTSPPLLEYDCTSNPLREIVEDSIPLPVNGFLSAPKGPGLGVVVNEESVHRFCADGPNSV